MPPKSASKANLKDEGLKGNNMPFQFNMLRQLKAIETAISSLPGVDYETRTTTYKATANGPGYSTNDIIIRYDIIDVTTGLVTTTVWFNQTTQAVIAAPAPGNITPYLPPGNVTINAGGVFTPAVRTPTLTRTTGAGVVAAGAKAVSVYNAGDPAGGIGTNATWLGTALKPGEQLNYSVTDQGDTLGAFAYTATATAELVITTIT